MLKIFGKLLVIIIPITLITLYGVYIFNQDRIAGDTASHLLLSISPILNIGVPYKDIWEIKPPAWPLTVYFWSKVFGYGILSIKIFNMVLIALVTIFVYLIYKKVFKTPVLELIFLFTILINLSPLLETLILPTEVLGLMFSLLGLFFLLDKKNGLLNFAFSGLAFFLASQTKEPYTFTVLSVIPLFVFLLIKGNYVELVKKASSFLLGIFGGIALILGYLISTDSQSAYLQIFKYKEIFYPFSIDRMFRNFSPAITATNNTFIQLYGGIFLLTTLAFVIFLLANKFKSAVMFNTKNEKLVSKSITIISKDNLPKYIVLFYAIGSFLGFGLGGVFGSHYLIQAVVPFYLLLGLIVNYIFEEFLFLTKKKKFYPILGAIVFFISLFIAFPKRQYIKSYLVKDFNLVTIDNIYSYEKRISELSSPDQCVLSVYGWGVGENYLYSGRKPCTRFFLPNMVREDWQKKEYSLSVINNPPAIIRYQRAGADMDINGFESGVINLGKIVKNCYLQDKIESTLYVPKIYNKSDLSSCIKANSI